eukprot:jgi/Ulvmu1/3558/UM166_0012.1
MEVRMIPGFAHPLQAWLSWVARVHLLRSILEGIQARAGDVEHCGFEQKVLYPATDLTRILQALATAQHRDAQGPMLHKPLSEVWPPVVKTQDARDRIYVNLQPDHRGPMHRHSAMLSTVETGHNRAPPSQRLEDCTHTRPSAYAVVEPIPPYAPEGRKYYAAIIGKKTASELRLPQKSGCSASYKVAQVVTYREPQPHPTWAYGRGAPAHGAQAPFHQRYAHYKMYGYAGRGAATSWARNRKMHILYDKP